MSKQATPFITFEYARDFLIKSAIQAGDLPASPRRTRVSRSKPFSRNTPSNLKIIHK